MNQPVNPPANAPASMSEHQSTQLRANPAEHPAAAVPSLHADAALAARLTQEAGRLALDMLAKGLTTEFKTSHTDVVSAADRAAEDLVFTTLRRDRPEDSIVGEEGHGHTGTSGRTWFIDPVDGTYNFLSGMPTWCSALGLVEHGKPVVGAVYHPAVDQLFVGGADLPTTVNGVPVPRIQNLNLKERALCTFIHPGSIEDPAYVDTYLRLVRGAATLRLIGSGSIELASVSASRLGAWAQRGTKDWDWYPGAALIEGAGGVARVVEVDGKKWHLCGSAAAVDQMAEIVRGASTQ